MKNKILGILIWLFFLIGTFQANAHKEWVHQYIGQEAFRFLEMEVGDVWQLRWSLGIDYNGPGNDFHGRGVDAQPWQVFPPTALGLWREDLEDVVYGHDIWDAGDPSSTHFWNADNGEWASTHISMFPYNIHVQNAWEKAHVFLFGDNHPITLKYVGTTPDGLSFPCTQLYITYPSLVELYAGHFTCYGFMNGGFPNIYNTPITITNPDAGQLEWAQRIALQILGRVAHLLADMSVPAHAHSDLHPCELPAGVGHFPDYFESLMGSRWYSGIGGGNDCSDDPAGTYYAQQWNKNTAKTQGNLLSEIMCMNDIDAMRFLFYTTNQIADHFPSGINPFGSLPGLEGQILPGLSGQDLTDGDNWMPQGLNDYNIENYLKNKNHEMGASPSYIHADDVADQTLNYAIRATATLFYWFAVRTGMTQTPYINGLYLQNFNLNDVNNMGGLSALNPFDFSIHDGTQFVNIENKDFIVAGSSVNPLSPQYGNFTIENPIEAHLLSANFISLEDGVTINDGVIFTAEIIDPFPCNIIYRKHYDSPLFTYQKKFLNFLKSTKKRVPDTSVSVEPNPSNGIFTIHLIGFDINSVSIRVLDPMGKTIKKLNYIEEKDVPIAINESLLNGIYFLEITDSNNNTYQSKIIIQK